jgi:hypothetical protein
MNNTTPRSIKVIAAEITKDWESQGKGVNYAAVPYLQAMYALDKATDGYYADSGASIVRYFLANANSWRGDTARAVKAELKAMIKGIY